MSPRAKKRSVQVAVSHAAKEYASREEWALVHAAARIKNRPVWAYVIEVAVLAAKKDLKDRNAT